MLRRFGPLWMLALACSPTSEEGAPAGGSAPEAAAPRCATATRPCYSGPAGTEGVGTCVAGRERCDEASGWSGRCEGEQVPRGESCSAPGDEDCDGQAGCVERFTGVRGYGGDVRQNFGNYGLTTLALGPAGEMWIGGRAPGTIELGMQSLKLGSGLVEGLYLARLDELGEHRWSRVIGRVPVAEALFRRTEEDEVIVHDIAVDAVGEVAVVVTSNRRLELGRAAVPAGGALTSHVARLGADGSVAWVRAIDPGAAMLATRVAFDRRGDVFVLAASVDERALDEGLVLAHGRRDGAERWRTRLIAENGELTVVDLAIDDAGIVVAGGFGGRLSAAEHSVGCAATQGACVYLLRLADDGAPRWLHGHGISGHTRVSALRADAQGLALTGEVGLVDFGGGPVGVGEGTGLYVARLDPAGEHRWSAALPAAAPGPARLALGRDGSVYLAGTYNHVLSVGPYETRSRVGRWDAFVAAFDPGGAVLWVEAMQQLDEPTVVDLHARSDGSLLLAARTHGGVRVRDLAARGSFFLATIDPGSTAPPRPEDPQPQPRGRPLPGLRAPAGRGAP